MHRIRIIRHLACALAGLAGALLALSAAPPAAFAYRLPPAGGPQTAAPAIPPQPPGWNKHPPLPAHAHTIATGGGLPGWQISLIVVTAVLVATAVAVTYRRRAARRRVSATTPNPSTAPGTTPAPAGAAHAAGPARPGRTP